jgi:hypothetical protein
MTMKLRSLCLAVALAGASVATTAAAPTLIAKPGLWSFTYVRTVTETPVPTGKVLNHEQLEQRAKMLAALKGKSAKPQTVNDTSCLTREDLTNGPFGSDASRPGCTRFATAATTTRRDGTFKCPGKNPSAGSIKFQVLSPDSVMGEVAGVYDVAIITVQFTGKWKAATCARH